ncbi:hypothetical protein BD289DRAFT_436567 [Coniella lustricola]|uniref:Uncharacterized protein n=1 Tax=Coniella lustricola TaxID=2025994 RepID=A0A2T3A534_9PEZI|nr:hypothetical protein BD289DRAFT_436567 [Coniella lustricola]
MRRLAAWAAGGILHFWAWVWRRLWQSCREQSSVAVTEIHLRVQRLQWLLQAIGVSTSTSISTSILRLAREICCIC